MLDLDDLETFVEVADAGGVSAAARRLGVSKSIVSRRLVRLEADLVSSFSRGRPAGPRSPKRANVPRARRAGVRRNRSCKRDDLACG